MVAGQFVIPTQDVGVGCGNYGIEESMQLSKIKFGTDGWRGVIADDFTFENVRRVAQATADYWNSMVGTNKAAIVGYDNRFSVGGLCELVCEVLAGMESRRCIRRRRVRRLR